MRTPLRLAAIFLVFVMSGSAALGQTVATKRVMREKLAHANKILEAIMTSDYVALEHHSAELGRATQSPGWFVLRSPEYATHSAAFVRANDDLVDAAKRRDLDAAAQRYVALTLTCFDCHRYVKNSRIASR
jgi:hypothetical protein